MPVHGSGGHRDEAEDREIAEGVERNLKGGYVIDRADIGDRKGDEEGFRSQLVGSGRSLVILDPEVPEARSQHAEEEQQERDAQPLVIRVEAPPVTTDPRDEGVAGGHRQEEERGGDPTKPHECLVLGLDPERRHREVVDRGGDKDDAQVGRFYPPEGHLFRSRGVDQGVAGEPHRGQQIHEEERDAHRRAPFPDKSKHSQNEDGYCGQRGGDGVGAEGIIRGIPELQ